MLSILFCYNVRVSVVLPRLIEPLVAATVRTVPVVILEGGRAVGKSTLCDRLISANGWSPRLDLSDETVLATLRLDPVRFLREQTTPCVLDEAQIEPKLPLWVKRVVDERKAPAQFVLTGSARLGRHALGGTDPLAGRSVRLTMWSLTQAELEGRATDFVARAFDGNFSRASKVPPPRPNAHLGGMPGITGVISKAPVANWEREIATYVEAVLPLGAAGTRADLGRLLRTFRYLAANSGQLLNFARAASELGMQAPTVKGHLEMLEAAFLLFRVEAVRPAEHRVVVAHPRVFAADPGFATWAARTWAGRLSAAARGSRSETLVAHDVAAIAHAQSERIVVRHWRDARNAREVDLVLVHPDGRTIPIEVKASTSVGPDDTKGLLAYAAEAGESCSRGVLIYEGSDVINLSPHTGPQIFALPRSLV